VDESISISANLQPKYQCMHGCESCRIRIGEIMSLPS